jgi:hypothetical protein
MPDQRIELIAIVCWWRRALRGGQPPRAALTGPEPPPQSSAATSTSPNPPSTSYEAQIIKRFAIILPPGKLRGIRAVRRYPPQRAYNPLERAFLAVSFDALVGALPDGADAESVLAKFGLLEQARSSAEPLR